VKSKEHRKRIGLYEEHQQIEWLERKGREAGFRVGTLTVIPEGKVRDTIRRNGSVVEIQFLSTQFEGVLQVLDPDRLRCALAQGIGSAKAFGFGLLSVAPA
jgi:CRISPR system Cascade subunit CasE